jgi:hypothetical protein
LRLPSGDRALSSRIVRPTPELTGRGEQHWRKDTSLARRAPVQRLVRRRPAVASTYSQSFFSSNSSIL